MGVQQSQNIVYSVPIEDKPEGSSAVRRNPLTVEAGLADKVSDQITTYQDIWKNCVSNFSQNIIFGQRSTSGDHKYYTRTYKEVNDICMEIGSGVLNLNLAETLQEYENFSLQMVGIYSKNREEWQMIDIGCGIMQGMTIVPLYDTLGADSLQYCLNHSGMSIVFASSPSVDNLLKVEEENKLKHIVAFDEITPEQKEQAKKRGLNLISLEELRNEGKKNIRPMGKVTPETIFTFSYTSGTTGVPKGAMLSHRNMVSMANVLQGHKDIKLQSDDVHLSYLPLPHAFDRCVCCGIMQAGGSIYFYNGDVQKLKQDIADVRPTVFFSVPRLYNKFYDAIMNGINSATGLKKFLAQTAINTKLQNLKENKILTHKLWDKLVFAKIRDGLFGGRVRYLLTGSAPISRDVIDFFQIACSAPMLEAYGQTESSAASFITFAEDLDIGHVGGPSVNIEFKVEDVPEMSYLSTDKDEEGNPTPRGEVCFRGPGVFAGYYKDKQKTMEAIDENGWLHSGDIGVINSKTGSLKIVDRKKNIFKLSQGEYVAPEKIEACYLKAPSSAEVFVYGDSLQSHTVAVVVPEKAYIEQVGKQLGLTLSFEELCKNKNVRKNVCIDLNNQGKRDKLISFEQVKNVYLEPVSLMVHGCLTNTMKMQRHNAKIFFKSQLDDMYKEGLLI